MKQITSIENSKIKFLWALYCRQIFERNNIKSNTETSIIQKQVENNKYLKLINPASIGFFFNEEIKHFITFN